MKYLTLARSIVDALHWLIVVAIAVGLVALVILWLMESSRPKP